MGARLDVRHIVRDPDVMIDNPAGRYVPVVTDHDAALFIGFDPHNRYHRFKAHKAAKNTPDTFFVGTAQRLVSEDFGAPSSIAAVPSQAADSFGLDCHLPVILCAIKDSYFFHEPRGAQNVYIVFG